MMIEIQQPELEALIMDRMQVEMLNFGAFIGFILVNLSIRQHF